MISYRKVLKALRDFNPVYIPRFRENYIHLLLAQHLATLFGSSNVKVNLFGREGIDIIIGNIGIEVKIRIPSFKTLYRQLKKYRRKYSRRRLILYIYTDKDLIPSIKKDLKKLRDVGVVDKIFVRCVNLKKLYKVEYKKGRYVIIPVKPELFEYP